MGSRSGRRLRSGAWAAAVHQTPLQVLSSADRPEHAPRATICSTMLLPNNAKARCATVSPTDARYRRGYSRLSFWIAGCAPCILQEAHQQFPLARAQNAFILASEFRKKRQESVSIVIRHTPPYVSSNVFKFHWGEMGSAFAETVAGKSNDYQTESVEGKRATRQDFRLMRNFYLAAIAPTIDWKIFIPSVPPSSGSADRSG